MYSPLWKKRRKAKRMVLRRINQGILTVQGLRRGGRDIVDDLFLQQLRNLPFPPIVHSHWTILSESHLHEPHPSQVSIQTLVYLYVGQVQNDRLLKDIRNLPAGVQCLRNIALRGQNPRPRLALPRVIHLEWNNWKHLNHTMPNLRPLNYPTQRLNPKISSLRRNQEDVPQPHPKHPQNTAMTLWHLAFLQ